MPVRTYGGNDFNVAGFTLTEDGNGSVIGSGANKSSTASAPPNSQGLRADYGYIDFTAFPSIPETALISRVTCKASCSGSVAETFPAEASSQSGILNITLPSTIHAQDQETLGIDGSYNRELKWEILYDPPITRAELITKFGSPGDYPTSGDYLLSQINSSAQGASGSSSASASVSNWSLEVEYDLESYSWYIKPTGRVFNGQPIQTIEDPDTDIVAVGEGDDPPSDEYEFYGSGEDFPDGPTYVWWQSSGMYLVFIESPISPGDDWTAISGSPPASATESTTVGSLDVLLADASGVYTLTPDKHNDTLYDRDASSTIEVKIPNPIIKGGFIP